MHGYLSSDAIREANKEVLSLISKEASKLMLYILRQLQKKKKKQTIIGAQLEIFLLAIAITTKRSGNADVAITASPPKKMGRPLLSDEKTGKKAQMHLLALCEVGGAVNCAITRASATGIIKRKNSNCMANL